MVCTEYSTKNIAGLIPSCVLEKICRMNQGSKADKSSLYLVYGSPQTFLLEGVPTWSVDLIFCAVPSTFFHPQARTMAVEAAFRGFFPLPANEGILESPRPAVLIP